MEPARGHSVMQNGMVTETDSSAQQTIELPNPAVDSLTREKRGTCALVLVMRPLAFNISMASTRASAQVMVACRIDIQVLIAAQRMARDIAHTALKGTKVIRFAGIMALQPGGE